MIALLERFLTWLDRRSGCFELTEPVILPHGSAWLRIAPGEQHGWYPTERQALHA